VLSSSGEQITSAFVIEAVVKSSERGRSKAAEFTAVTPADHLKQCKLVSNFDSSTGERIGAELAASTELGLSACSAHCCRSAG
jgi:hypothetical protein